MKTIELSKSLMILSMILILGSLTFGQNLGRKTLVIADRMVDCSAGAGKSKCMLVSEDESKTWKYFYNKIDGFTFKNDYTQKIVVSVSKLTNPPADASSLSYKLVQTVRSKKTNGQSARVALQSLENSKANMAGLGGTKWHLIRMNNRKPVAGTAMLMFDENSKKYAAKACNSANGDFSLYSGKRIKFSENTITTKACATEYSSFEKEYRTLLNQVTRYSISGSYLNLYLNQNDVLQFTNSSDWNSNSRANKSLEGTKWALSELNSIAINPGSSIPTLYFDSSDHRVKGFGGCNKFSGTYKTMDDIISFGALAMTRKACMDKHVSSIENVLGKILQGDVKYKIDGASLHLYKNGEIVAKYIAMNR